MPRCASGPPAALACAVTQIHHRIQRPRPDAQQPRQGCGKGGAVACAGTGSDIGGNPGKAGQADLPRASGNTLHAFCRFRPIKPAWITAALSQNIQSQRKLAPGAGNRRVCRPAPHSGAQGAHPVRIKPDTFDPVESYNFAHSITLCRIKAPVGNHAHGGSRNR